MRWLVATATCAALAGTLAHLSGDEAARARALRRASVPALDELAMSAGMLGDDWQLRIPEPLAVQTVQGGGPGWMRESIASELPQSRAFREGGSPHLLRIEGVDAERGFATQLRLWRAGWDLRLPQPVRRRMQPGTFGAAVGVGACVWAASRRLAWGVLVAGLASVLALALFALELPVPGAKGLMDELAHAPFWVGLSALFTANEQLSTSLIFALVAFCLVLAYFDHRRSRDDASSLTLPRTFFDALALGAGGLLLVETALRSGWWDALSSLWGGLGALALVGACVAARFAASSSRGAAAPASREPPSGE